MEIYSLLQLEKVTVRLWLFKCSIEKIWQEGYYQIDSMIIDLDTGFIDPNITVNKAFDGVLSAPSTTIKRTCQCNQMPKPEDVLHL